jgi:hypothetical protein
MNRRILVAAAGLLFMLAGNPGSAQPPAPDASQAPASVEVGKPARIRGRGASLVTDMSGPGPTIARLRPGTRLEVLGRERQWYRVRVPGIQQEGFVLVEDVQLLGLRPALSYHGVASFGLTSFTSTKGADVIAGRHSKTTFGVGAEVGNLWRGLLAGVTYAPLSLDGQRVFIDEGTVYPLGIPVTIAMKSLDIVGGWRFIPKSARPAPVRSGQPAQRTAPRLVPFVGGGMSLVFYRETSPYAASGEDVSEAASGFVLLGGVDYAVGRWLRVGGEFRYRAINGVLGAGGASQVLGERSLGGYAFAARVSIGR